MKYDMAGDPMTGLRWTKRTTRKVAKELQRAGIHVSARTVARLLKDMGFSLRVNRKSIASASSKDRNEQFEFIAALREDFAKAGDPIVSVDSKKKELIGRFKNAGTTWTRDPVSVNDHDFRSHASGIAIPYGVYDLLSNSASVNVGTSFETPEFAVKSVAKWLRYRGRRCYPKSTRLLILADNGGGNGAAVYAWKYFLQSEICDRYEIEVTVAHYPPGTSKWNPIEHRVFSHISANWQGRPLDTYQTCLNYIATTRTAKGLTVKPYLDQTVYTKGLRISKAEMEELDLVRSETLPKWNYTLRPR